MTHATTPETQNASVGVLSVQFPLGSCAVYTPEGATLRDIVIVDSEPDEDGIVEVLSARQAGKTVRVPLGKLQPLPELPPQPEGEPTDCWSVTDRSGAEVARVHGADVPAARVAVERHPVAGPVSRREGGIALRRLRTSELSVPLGELSGPPRTSTAS